MLIAIRLSGSFQGRLQFRTRGNRGVLVKRILVFMLVLSLLVIGGTLVSAQGQSRQREQVSLINFTDHNLQTIERRNSDGIR